MNAGELLARHGEHAGWVIVAQILLYREGKFGKIGKLLQIIGVHTGSIKSLLVVGHIGVSMVQRPFQPLQLQGGDFIA